LGFLQALVFGALAACIIFALDVSATDVVRAQFGLDERASSIVRSAQQKTELSAHGNHVVVLQLGSYLFFGSAYRVQEHVNSLSRVDRLHMVIFDFTAVTGIDTSAAASFARMCERLREAGTRSLICGVPPSIARFFHATGAVDAESILPDLDSALELGERELLAQYGLAANSDRPLLAWLETALGNVEYARELVSRLVLVGAAPTGYLCRQGDAAETLLFIERGRVTALAERPDQEPMRVRVFDAQTIAGEIGFFLGTPRSASLKVEPRTIVWSLDRASFRKLADNRPDIALLVFEYIVRIQSERLAFATRRIAA
jgi:SulP family sulfate permease